ncbi:MAG: hypothetical protein ACYCVD_05225 [Desulfitobacteriaceae bacterium]
MINTRVGKGLRSSSSGVFLFLPEGVWYFPELNALEEWLIYLNDIQGEELEAIAMSMVSFNTQSLLRGAFEDARLRRRLI